jgi:hypothetical protein
MTEILSDDDHRAFVRDAELVCTAGWPIHDLIRYGRAVERAVFEKMAAMGGELPEPARSVLTSYGSEPFYFYGESDMKAHYARGVAAGMALSPAPDEKEQTL